MSTLGQAVARARENGKLPPSGPISIRALLNQFQPSPPESLRALILKMLTEDSQKLPWAVILCRFKGSLPDPTLEGPIESFFREAFAPGSGGLVEYWQDVSLGSIDIAGSRVFGWIEVEIPRSKAGGTPQSVPPGPGRSGLIDYAINAVKHQDGEDALNGFLGPIAVYTQNWSKNGAPAGADWRTPGWFQFWIDGSADGKGRVCLTPPHDGNITAHEMGHVFNMNHDVGPDLKTHYADPCCIMSQNNAFLHPRWQRNFGPAVCLPHLMQRDWMYKSRVVYDDAWQFRQNRTLFVLAPITRPLARWPLGIKLAYKQGESTWDYYLQYVEPTDWDRGVQKHFLFIRRIMPVDVGPTPIILASIEVPIDGTEVEFVEPTGNVRFQVKLIHSSILEVLVLKL